jgi:hypothetical protein
MAKKEPIYRGLSKLIVQIEDTIIASPDYFKIVNLERRPDRKQNVENQLKKESIHPSWVRAIDGRSIDPTAALKKLFLNNDFGSKRGVIGCALSHLNLWKQLVSDPLHEYYIVLDFFDLLIQIVKI